MANADEEPATCAVPGPHDEDFESVLGNKHKFLSVYYTDTDTYLSKDPSYKPVEEETALSLFEGL